MTVSNQGSDIKPGDFSGAEDEMYRRIADAVTQNAAELIGLSHQIHAEPELAFAEYRSSQAVAKLIEAHGYRAQIGCYGLDTALEVNAGVKGPLVAIIAEYDALPGLGHACGHNIIAATATGAFLALAPEVMALGGRVRLLATPAEEGGGGKEIIARAGGFDDVDCAMMIHPRDRDVAIGSWAALRQVKVGYTGLQAHAAVSPWLGRNALDAAVSAYNGIAQLRQHIHPGERVHGVFTAAGDRPNIVPHVSGLEYYLRAGDIESLERLTDQVDAVFRGAATMAGVDVEIQWDLNPVYVPVRTNVALAVRYASIATRRGRLVSLTPEVSSGSTDMGNVSVRVPSIHPSLATAPLGVGLHSAEFARQAVSAQADEAVVDGAIALASTAADFLADIDLRRAVRDEFELEGGVVDVANLKAPGKR